MYLILTDVCHNVQGTFPMGLSTIINMVVFVCVPAWGDGAAVFAWVLWWIDVALAVACNFYIPYAMMQTPGVSLLVICL